MDTRVQSLYASVEHLGKSGEIADVFHGQARLAQRARSAACRNKFNSESRQNPRKFYESRFVCYAEQRSPNLLNLPNRCTHRLLLAVFRPPAAGALPWNAQGSDNQRTDYIGGLDRKRD